MVPSSVVAVVCPSVARQRAAPISSCKRQAEKSLGKAINPHHFRDAAVTTLAVEDPQHVRLASPLLGPRHPGTTERHYQQAQALEAHREFVGVLGKVIGDDLSRRSP